MSFSPSSTTLAERKYSRVLPISEPLLYRSEKGAWLFLLLSKWRQTARVGKCKSWKLDTLVLFAERDSHSHISLYESVSLCMMSYQMDTEEETRFWMSCGKILRL